MKLSKALIKSTSMKPHEELAVLEIKSWDTTASVEQKIKDIFGLNVQIFRYDALGCWIQTTLSDALTLNQLSRFAYDGLTANQGVRS
jgi:hypothetical protein